MTRTRPARLRPASSRLRPLIAALLTALLVMTGITLTAGPASAAEGDVSSATLQWGVKQSFRSYVSGPIAAGSWSVAGSVVAEPAFTWSGGVGTVDATASTGSVGYEGSIHFTGHEGLDGVGEGAFGLDLTLSNVRVQQQSATAATIVVDAISNSLSDPTTFVTRTDVPFAIVDLASATSGSDDATVAFNGAPTTLTAEGAEAFAGFYEAGAELDAVSFSWPTEQAPVVSGPTDSGPADTGSATPAPVTSTPVTPTIVLSKSVGLNAAGDTVVVTGTGFGPVAGAVGARPPLAGKFSGVYVQFGKFADVWQPSAGAGSSARVAASTFWVVSPEDVATIGGAQRGAVALQADGSFTIEMPVRTGFDMEPSTGNYGVYTSAGSGAKFAPFETYTPVAFATPAPVTPTPVVIPAAPAVIPAAPTPIPVVQPQADAGSLSWGIKGSFRSYVAGPIARGSLTTSGVGNSGGAFIFGQAAGGSFSAASATGSAQFSGAVRFQGHSGALDVTIANPSIYVESPTSATLYVRVNGGGPIAFAMLDLGSGIRTTPGGTVTWSSVPAYLTPAGASVFSLDGSNFYAAGTALDPVRFSIGAPSEGAGAAATTTVASYSASAPRSASALTTPKTATTAASCAVDGATIRWGFKESFRSYISSSIAKGEWSVADGATYTTPDFGFSEGKGTWGDAGSTVVFPGSITFTGHDGILNTTVSNPELRYVDDDSAILVMDVSGTTQEGEAVDAQDVEFADLDLSGASVDKSEGTVIVTKAPAVLTEAGSAAFGTYPAGEKLDPVTFALTLDSACADGAITPAPAPTATTTPDDPSSTDAAPVSSQGPDLLWLLWVVGALALFVLIPAIVMLARRRPGGAGPA